MVVIIPTLVGLILLTLTGFIIFSYRNYKNRFNVKYNPLNMFPYELNYDASFKDNFFGNLFLIFTSLISIVFYVLIIKSSTNGFIILLAISGMLMSILLSVIPLLPLTFLKTHLLMDVLFFISVLVSILSNALIALRYYQTWLTSDGNPSLVLMIIYFASGGIYLLFLLNPKISLWTKMEKVDNSDGSSYYKRPKLFSLAYTEWLSYIFYLLSISCTLISFIAKIL